MAFGLGRKIKRLGRKTEGLARSGASAIKSGYTSPGASIRGEASRIKEQVKGAATVAGGQAEAQAKRVGKAVADVTGISAQVGATQRQLAKLGPDETALPPTPEVAPMPLPDEALSMVARRRQRARRRGARGSSILSGQQDTLG